MSRNSWLVISCALVLASAAAGQSGPAFAGPFHYPGGVYFFGTPIQLLDLDGDGRDDVVTRSVGLLRYYYALSQPNGSFGPTYEVPWPQSYGPSGALESGDGTADMIVGAGGTTPSLLVFNNSGRVSGGTQPLAWSAGIPWSIPSALVGHVSMAVSFVGSTAFVVSRDVESEIASKIEVFDVAPPIGAGSPPLVSPTGRVIPTPPGPNPPALAYTPCNLDGDGEPDLIIRTQAFLSVSHTLWRWTPSGSVATFAVPPLPASAVLRAADVTGDGRDDLLVFSTSPFHLAVCINEGPLSGGGIAFVPRPDLPGWRTGELGDLDGDGDLDLVCAGPGPNPTPNVSIVGVFTNDGIGQFSWSGALSTITTYPQLALGDVEADGDVDLAIGSQTVQILLNQTVAACALRPGTPESLVLGSAVVSPATPAPPFSHSPFFDLKTANGSSVVNLELVAPSFAGQAAYLVGEVFHTGEPPFGMLNGIHVSGGPATVAMGPYAVPPNGRLAFSFPSGVGLAPVNLSALVQFVVVDDQAANGSYAATEAHEFQF